MSPRLHIFILLVLTLMPATALATVLAVEPTIDNFNPFQSFGGTTISAVAIGSWTWIFKWMVNQLELQRQAHSAAQSQLIEYMKDDHALLVSTNGQLVSALGKAMTTLNQITVSKTNQPS